MVWSESISVYDDDTLAWLRTVHHGFIVTALFGVEGSVGSLIMYLLAAAASTSLHHFLIRSRASSGLSNVQQSHFVWLIQLDFRK
jgi:hypothetical protein